jgi:hypothetical protein
MSGTYVQTDHLTIPSDCYILYDPARDISD